MRWPHPVEAELHISSELSRSGLSYKTGHKNFKVNCPFPHPKGDDKSMNLEITKDGRKAHCWVCNWSGSWNKLAKVAGLTPFGSDEPDTYSSVVLKSNVFDRLGQDLAAAFEEDLEVGTLPSGISPWPQPLWRGLSREFLSTVPSYLWKQEVKFDTKTFYVDRILWPYVQNNRLVGWSGRRLDKSKKMKYYRAPWSHAKKVLFPYDYVRSNYSCDTIVLVEGEVDALNLLQAGIPALAILGTGNWGQEKIDLLLALGTEKIFLLLDPDPAGMLARDEIKNDLTDLMSVTVLNISGEDDPGSLDSEQLLWLKNRVIPKGILKNRSLQT